MIYPALEIRYIRQKFHLAQTEIQILLIQFFLSIFLDFLAHNKTVRILLPLLPKVFLLIGKQDQYAASYGGLNFIRFNQDGTVSVSPIMMQVETYKKLQKNKYRFSFAFL